MHRAPANKFFAYAFILTLVGSLFSLVLPASQPSYASHENITFEVDRILYDQGDDVAITGSIDEVESDDDEVTIKIKGPNLSTSTLKTQDVTLDDDIFEYVYSISGSADDGVYTIEVEYNNEKAYSFFMVDEDEDPVRIVSVDDTYAAGDQVDIEGDVANTESAVEEVEITIIDPNNAKILNSENIELDNDEFSDSFDLSNSAEHGRYAVIVTYDVDDQEGGVVFEIADEGEGDEDDSCEGGDSDDAGDLSAELGADAYAPGDTVCVSGNIDNYDSGDSEDLEIVVEDPDGEEVDAYGEDNADVENNDDFLYEFDLEDDADAGAYSVVITYAGDEVVLTFEVEEDDAGGSDDLTVRLNKATYLAGETMTVSGTVADVADPEDGEQVSIFVYMPEGQVILKAGSSKYVTPSSSGAYSATIVIPSDLEEDEDYTVKVSYLGESVEASFDITGISSTPSDEITVETDEDEYNIGSTVEISGEVPDALIVDGQQLLIRVNKPDGNPCRIDPIDVPSGGSFTYELVLGGTCGEAGEYKVEVTYGGEEGQTTFELIGSSASKYNLNVEGDTYPIEYELTDGTINSMFVRPVDNKLVINIDAPDDGQLTVVLPREVIDAIEDGEDITYVVTIEEESGDVIAVDVEESENTDDARTLVIDYPAGAERIEITGTQVVPEFGAIAAIIMAVAIVGMILTTAKFNKLSLFRQ